MSSDVSPLEALFYFLLFIFTGVAGVGVIMGTLEFLYYGQLIPINQLFGR